MIWRRHGTGTIGWLVALVLALLTPVYVAAACSCEDGFSSIAGCCGGDGQRSCALFPVSPLSQCSNVCETGKVFTATLGCATPRLVGELCGPAFPCATGNTCTLMTNVDDDTTLELRCAAGQSGVPGIDPGTPLGLAQCELLHSKAIHDGTKAGTPGANGFGVGGESSLGIAGSYEIGTVYGRNGEFGCYRTECVGGALQAGFGAYATWSVYDQYSGFAGDSLAVIQEGSAGIAGASFGAFFFNPLIYPNNVTQVPPGSSFLGTAGALSIGVSINPISASIMSCRTTVTESMRWMPASLGPEQWVDTAGVAVNPDGTPQKPLHSLGDSLTSLQALVTTEQKKVFVQGLPTVSTGQTIDFPVEIHATNGPVTITAQ